MNERRVIALNLALAELKPSDKYRLALIGLPANRWLADLRFVARDESLYIMPLFDRAFKIWMRDSAERYTVAPRSGFHISVHHSGRLNLSFGSYRSKELRPWLRDDPATGPLFAIVVNGTNNLPIATDEAINQPARG